ncbi:efflux RND transporter permease subunit [Pedobacter sp. SYP-B3415]|uniref:efflux RND transporter permease subunit n=1 Tax=Pedobacter sp. SYP-B3415 TaxID=2496641 RepID=UPI00101D141D|nr:efflux RND transporter permease subunit [Pedobacter sp. SYP-B3415]
MRTNRTFTPFAIITIATLLSLIGLIFIADLSIRSTNEETEDQLSIQFRCRDRPAFSVERDITSKIESLLSKVEGISHIRSVSQKGMGYIQSQLDNPKNTGKITNEVSLLLRQIRGDFPDDLYYEISSSSLNIDPVPIITYMIIGDEQTSQRFVSENLNNYLTKIDGIEKTVLEGVSEKSIKVTFKDAVIHKLGLSRNDFIDPLLETISDMHVSKIESSHQKNEVSYIIQTPQVTAFSQFSELPIKKIAGKILKLVDVAEISIEKSRPPIMYSVNGNRFFKLNITAKQGANHLRMVSEIQRKVSTMNSTDTGVEIRLLKDNTLQLRRSFENSAYKLCVSITILVIFVFVSTRNWKVLALVVVSLVSNLLTTCLICRFLDVVFYPDSIACLAITSGVFADNCIIQIYNRQERRKRGLNSIVISALIIFIAILAGTKFTYLKGNDNLRDIGLLLIINLGICLIVLVSLVPALKSKLLIEERREKLQRPSHRFSIPVLAFYFKIVSVCSKHTRLITFIILMVMGLPLFLLPKEILSKSTAAQFYNSTMGNRSIRPWFDRLFGGVITSFAEKRSRPVVQYEPDQSELLLKIVLPSSSPDSLLAEIVMKFENQLQAFGQRIQYLTEVNGSETATIKVTFPRNSNLKIPQILKEDLESLAGETGLAEFTLQGYGRAFNNKVVDDRIKSTITLLGYRYASTVNYSLEIIDSLKNYERITAITLGNDISNQMIDASPQLGIRIAGRDRLLIDELEGFEIERILKNLPGTDQYLGNSYDEQKLTPVVARSSESQMDLWRLAEKPFRIDSSRYIKLAPYINVDTVESATMIERYDQQYQLSINYHYVGDQYRAHDIKQNIINVMNEKMPIGYKIDDLNQNLATNEARKYAMTLISILLVTILISIITLESFRRAILILVVIVPALIGAFISQLLFNLTAADGSIAGVLFLCGISANASLYILSNFRSKMTDVSKTSLGRFKSATIRHVFKKLGPISLGSLTLLLGILPFVITKTFGDFWHSFSVSVIGGILFHQLAISFLLPSYLLAPYSLRRR